MKKRLLFFMVLMSAALSVQAQELQSNAWNALFTDYSFTASTTLRLETHFRTRDFYSTRDQILVRPGLSYKIAPGASVTAGVTYLNNNTAAGNVVENNIWQQFGFSFPLQRARFLGWIRAEQRWINRPDTAVSFGHRIRFRTGFGLPLTPANAKKTEFIVFNEVFMNFKKGFPYTFNQNWTFLGFQKTLSPNAKLLSGFQRVSVNGGQGYVHKNIWSSILFYKL